MYLGFFFWRLIFFCLSNLAFVLAGTILEHIVSSVLVQNEPHGDTLVFEELSHISFASFIYLSFWLLSWEVLGAFLLNMRIV